MPISIANKTGQGKIKIFNIKLKSVQAENIFFKVFLDSEPEDQQWDSLNASMYPDKGNKIHKILLKYKNMRDFQL